MSEADYLLSVVIPTRNRQNYAIQAVKQILDTTDQRTQVIVQDNSDDQSLATMIEEMKDTRVKYHYTSEQLSFVDNFEIATSMATGEYVTLIGDDDGVLPSITAIAQYALQNGYDCVTSKVLVTYYWPNSGAKKYGCSEETGYIRINKYSNHASSVNVLKCLKKVLRNGCQFYHRSGIPKIYHGLVKNSLLEEIREKHGRLFKGLSPDIYSAFCISLMNKKTLYLDFPYTIDGNCRKSGAGAQAQGKHTGKLKDAPHFRGNPDYQWENLVPKVYSIQTIWADSGLAALRNMKQEKLIEEFNLERLCAYIMLNNRSIWKDTFVEYRKIRNVGYLMGTLRLIPSFLVGPIPDLVKRIWSRVIGLGKTGTIINDVSNIHNAGDIIDSIIGEWKGDKNARF